MFYPMGSLAACTTGDSAYYWSLLLLIPAFIISAVAQARIQSTYKKYAQVPDRSGTTGAQFAAEMLRANDVNGVRIQAVSGTLSDHFDPRNDTVNLSESVYRDHSVASVAIAAHECGHVLQKFTNYTPMKIRSSIVPIVNICSNLSMPIILIGMIFASFRGLVDLGAWLFFATVVFQLVTLPVEFNASSRALKNIEISGVLTQDELAGAKKMLSAAAMTYVAAMISSFMSFLRLIIIANSSRR